MKKIENIKSCPKCGGKLFCEPTADDGGGYSYKNGFELRCMNGHRFQGYRVSGAREKFCIIENRKE